MSTVLTCKSCGFSFTVPATFTNISIKNMRSFVTASCPSCHEVVREGGADGTYSTGPDGRLTVVAQTLARSDRAQLESLQVELQRIAARQDHADARRAAEQIGWQPSAPQTRKSRLASGNEALEFIIKLQVVIALLLTGTTWTAHQVQQLLEQWTR